jgi:hypothetical protein
MPAILPVREAGADIRQHLETAAKDRALPALAPAARSPGRGLYAEARGARSGMRQGISSHHG